MRVNFDKIKYLKNSVYHHSAGGVVFYNSKKSLKVALLKLIDNGWTISKGHLKEGETSSIFIKSRLFELNGKIIKDGIDRRILLEAQKMVEGFSENNISGTVLPHTRF